MMRISKGAQQLLLAKDPTAVRATVLRRRSLF
jgi:hypothetical protein